MTSTEEYRSRINQISENVKEEPEMKKMRDDISEGIGTTGNRQADVEEQFQQVIEETTDKDIVSAPEIIAARNGKPNLKQRLDDENENVTRQLAQTAANLKTFGAKGDGVTDDSEVITDVINNYDNIFVPEGEFICSPTVFENLKRKYIFGFGTIKVKSGSDRAGLFNFVNCEEILIERVTLDGNRGNVSAAGVGGWDDILTFEDSDRCSVKYATLQNSTSLGISCMNSSTDNVFKYNTFNNIRLGAIQIRG